jgi:apolipoprotein N-acyltransferase
MLKLKRFFNKNKFYILLSILFPVLLYLSQAPYSIGVLRWIAFIPLFFILFSDKLSLKRKMFFSWFSVFLFILMNGVLILHMHPLDWLGIDNSWASLSLVFFLWIIYGIVLSLTAILFPVFMKYAPEFLFPLAWMLQEYSRSFLFSFLTLGDTLYFGPFFSLAFIGYGISSNSFLVNLIPVNVYLWGVVIVFVNYFFFISLRKMEKLKDYKKVIVLMIFILLIATEFVPSIEPVQKIGVNVGSIQADNDIQFSYSEQYRNEVSNIFKNKIKILLKEHPETNIIVLPENSNLFYAEERFFGIPKEEFILNLIGNETYRVIIYSDYDGVRKKLHLTALSNNESENLQPVEKNYLMVLGEYQPYLYKFILYISGKKDTQNRLENVRELNKGNQNQSRIIKTNIGKIAPVGCSEILVPKVYEKIKNSEPDLIVHQQRLATFHDDTKAFYQVLEMGRFHAAVLDKYIVGSVDGGGYSYIINPNGKIIKIGGPKDDYVYASI